MPLSYVTKGPNGVVEQELISDSSEATEAVRDLQQDLWTTASIEYSIPVLEWWFTNRHEALTVPNGTDKDNRPYTDTWTWDGN